MLITLNLVVGRQGKNAQSLFTLVTCKQMANIIRCLDGWPTSRPTPWSPMGRDPWLPIQEALQADCRHLQRTAKILRMPTYLSTKWNVKPISIREACSHAALLRGQHLTITAAGRWPHDAAYSQMMHGLLRLHCAKPTPSSPWPCACPEISDMSSTW